MKRRSLSLLLLLSGAAVLLDAQLHAPKAGVVRYPDGTVHTVYGLSANYVVDGHPLTSADAASFSDAGGLLANHGKILLTDTGLQTIASFDSGESAPLLNIDGDLKSAVAWLPIQQALLHWNGSALVLTSVHGGTSLGAVTSIRLTRANTAELLVTNRDNTVSQATVALDSGEVTSVEPLPGIRGPAFQQQSFVVFRDERGLEIATSSAVIQTLPLPASAARLVFERMSSNAVHLISSASKQSWVLHLGASLAPQLSQLPESALVAADGSPEAAQ